MTKVLQCETSSHRMFGISWDVKKVGTKKVGELILACSQKNMGELLVLGHMVAGVRDLNANEPMATIGMAARFPGCHGNGSNETLGFACGFKAVWESFRYNSKIDLLHMLH